MQAAPKDDAPSCWFTSVKGIKPEKSAGEVVFREEITEGERLEVLLKG